MRPNWINRLKAENAALQAELAEAKMQQHYAAFTRAIGENLALLMLMRDPATWTSTERAAWEAAAAETPTTAACYALRSWKRERP